MSSKSYEEKGFGFEMELCLIELRGVQYPRRSGCKDRNLH